jgi:hypothetical protein
LSRVAEGDALVKQAADAARPIVIAYDANASEPPPARHLTFGDPWSALVAPVLAGEALLGSIELVDPLDGAPFGKDAEAALRFLAERYGAHVSEHGVDLSRVAKVTED